MTWTATAVRIPTARRGPAGTSPGTFRRDVVGLRAVAVALIVLCHAGMPGLAGGYVGADVFFVISGYLVTTRMSGDASPLAFFGRRVRRLLPAAALVLVALAVVPRHRLGLQPAGHLGADAVWSVVVYLGWPAVLVLLRPASRRFGPQRTLPFVFGCVVGASLAWSALHAGPWSYFAPLTRPWEIGAGALLALAGDDRHRIPYRLAGGLSWLGLVLIVASALVLRPGTPWPGIAAVVPAVGALLVLTGRGDGLLGLPPLQGLGRISYPLYLWHWPVLLLAGHRAVAERGVLVLVAAGLALTTYVLVERPFRP